MKRCDAFLFSSRLRLDVCCQKMKLLSFCHQFSLCSEELQLIIENRSAAELARNRVLVLDRRVETGLRLVPLFHSTNEAMEALETGELVFVAESCGIE